MKTTTHFLSVLLACFLLLGLSLLIGCKKGNIDQTDNPDPTQSTKTTTVTTTAPETKLPAEKESSQNVASNLSPEFKAAMDAYESFYDEYCAFMKKYKENPSDFSLLTQYANIMEEAVKVDATFKKWNDENLNDAEVQYYLEVQSRVLKKIAEVSGN